jgi:TfoX/Sxy family transcriptional regulator of competence genes
VAEPYLKHLSQMVSRLELPRARGITLESRHFFSGAALYANGKICASLSPMGLAVKLPADMREDLIKDGKGDIFRFFASGPIKQEYVALPESILQDDETLREFLNTSINYVANLRDSDVVGKTG